MTELELEPWSSDLYTGIQSNQSLYHKEPIQLAPEGKVSNRVILPLGTDVSTHSVKPGSHFGGNGRLYNTFILPRDFTPIREMLDLGLLSLAWMALRSLVLVPFPASTHVMKTSDKMCL